MSSTKSLVRAPLITMKCNNKVNSKCEVQQKITESVEKNLCRRVGLGQVWLINLYINDRVLYY